MNRLFIMIASIAFLAAGTMNLQAAGTDDQGHTLVSLWKTYEQAVKADKPKSQVAALEEIMKAAKDQKLSWDYFDASRKRVDARVSTNWKVSNVAREDFRKDALDYPDPVVALSYYIDSYDRSAVSAFLKENQAKLEKGNSKEFYTHLQALEGLPFSEVLPKYVKNDYEFGLWVLFRMNDTEIVEALAANVRGRYPLEPFMEFQKALRVRDLSKKDSLSALVKKYDGKAAALFPEQALLQIEFSELESSEKSTSDQYKALREKCSVFVAKRDHFKGGEGEIAACCISVDNLIETLDRKDIFLNVKDGELTVKLRNLSKVQVQVIKDKKSVWSIMLFSKENSYYTLDEVKTTIPDTLEDGDYEIKCSSGKVSETADYQKYTLSIARKRDAKGYGVYVADYMTGEPVKSCTLELLDSSDKVIASAPVKLDGYAYLPESFKDFVSNRKARLSVRAAYSDGKTMRRSGGISLNSWYYDISEEEVAGEQQNAIIITDRAAFNPGETVKFKLVLFEGKYEYRTSPAGKTVSVVLIDSQESEVGKKFLSVNEFGSAAGEFKLDNIERGGRFRLEVRDGRNTLATGYIRVDEFVLPTFELKWDDQSRFFLPGETVKVSGVVKSYSGHSLSGARLQYTVKKYWEDDKSGELLLGNDGNFEISFPASDNGWTYYQINAKVIDATGEVQEFDTSVYSGKNIPFNVEFKNGSKGNCSIAVPNTYGSASILAEDVARIEVNVKDDGPLQLTHPSLKIRYELRQANGKKVLKKGKATPGEVLELAMSDLPSGLYEFWAEASAKSGNQDYATEDNIWIMKVSDSDEMLNDDVRSFFKEIPGDDIALQIGSTEGPTWAVVELYGSGNVLLEHQIVYLEGEKGKAWSLKTIRYKYKDSYPSAMKLMVLWFKKGTGCRYSMNVNHFDSRSALPLEFTRFLDTTAPGQQYSFSVKTESGVECAATIFDVSSETIMANVWRTVSPLSRPVPTVDVDTKYGVNSTGYTYLTKSAGMKLRGAAANAAVTYDYLELADDEEMLCETAVVVGYGASVAEEEAPVAAVREDFAATIAWEPFLRSDKDGVISFSFKTADKLSRYYVQLFAHNKDMGNNVLRQEMTVTLPVKVAVVEPQILYKGDRYVVNVTVSNSIEKKINGKLTVKFLEGKDYKNGRKLLSKTVRMTVPAKGNQSASVELDSVGDMKDLGLLVSFDADDKSYGSDAVFVTVPVKIPLQTISESHSAILLDGADAVELENMLRSEFVNMSGDDAAFREISIRQMLGETLPQNIEPEADDVLSLTDALYARYLLSALSGKEFDNAAIESKIQACRNSDGGFGWFEGMKSSSVVTAVVLERFAGMKRDFAGSEEAVHYLDKAQLGGSKVPFWCGGIDYAKYMYIRAMYAKVPFNAKELDSKYLKDFRKDAKDYLVPSESRGLNGRIIEKARRLLTLRMLMASPKGESLAREWGVLSVSKMAASVKADIESLYEYAEPHKCGGYYYPNAVMPFRGLLESELYAHSLLCDLLSTTERKDIADGIKLWMMIQKETQQWESDPAYIQALNSVFHGSNKVLNTKVLALTASAELPFSYIQAAGNGFTLERKYYVNRSDGKWEELQDGEVLKLGDEVRADYRIWNEENRSFVKLSVPRPACLRPEEQLSGRYGWWLSPLRAEGWYVFNPQGYRNVKADRTEYFFDTYPEENTTISELFFVTQEGTFASGVPEIESLYAPHYRANTSGTSPMTVTHE